MSGTLTGLAIYPIKSCGGIKLEQSTLCATGLRYDRRWMLVDSRGRMLTQRRHPETALVRPRFDGENLLVEAPRMPSLRIPIIGETIIAQNNVAVRTWQGWAEGVIVGEKPNRWFTDYLRAESRLVRMTDSIQRTVVSAYAEDNDFVSYADAFPLLLVNAGSLADLNGRLARPIPTDRFRPNLIVSGFEPFEEDAWRRINVGSTSFRVAEPCPRCMVVTIDQTSGEKTGTEALRALSGYRRADRRSGKGVFFGANLIHDQQGILRVGDRIETLANAYA